MDASNIFKPALSRGELQCIGATTLMRNTGNILKKTPRWIGGFSQSKWRPSIDDTVKILHGIRSKYEDHHNVTYTDKALEAAAKLTDRYVTGKFLPDKAIDAIDEAGADCSRMESMKRPQEIEDLSDEIKKSVHSKKVLYLTKILKMQLKQEIRKRNFVPSASVSLKAGRKTGNKTGPK